MDPNVMYLFKYESENDESEYFAKIDCNDIVWADTVETDGLKIKSRYCFRVELKDKVHVFCHDVATVVNNWLRAVKTGKRCQMEGKRSQKEEITKNIDRLVWLYKRKNTDEILKYVKTEFEDSLRECSTDETAKIAPFIKAIKRCQDNMTYVDNPYVDSRCSPS